MENLTLRQHRVIKDITMERMAKMLGIHVNTYAEWEKNPAKISIEYAIKICEILEVHPNFIIFLPNVPTNMLNVEKE